MRKLIAVIICVLGCCQYVGAQLRKADSTNQPQQSEAQVSPTPLKTDPQINDQGKAERERREQDRDSKEDTFREDQKRQNKVIADSSWWMAGFAGANVVIALVYAIFAYRTLSAVQVQAKAAARQVEKMGQQLKAMHNQGSASFRQIRYAREALLETRKMVEQNERAVIASEKSAAIAEESLNAEQPPYFGITDITLTELHEGRNPRLNVTFMNGGLTPAWHFEVEAWLVLGRGIDDPDSDRRKFYRGSGGNMGMTSRFFPRGAEKVLTFYTAPLSNKEFLDVQDEGRTLWITGVAYYRWRKGYGSFPFDARYNATIPLVEDCLTGKEPQQ